MTCSSGIWGKFFGEQSSPVVEPGAEAAFDLIRPFKTSRRAVYRNDLLQSRTCIRRRLIVGTIYQISQAAKDTGDAPFLVGILKSRFGWSQTLAEKFPRFADSFSVIHRLGHGPHHSSGRRKWRVRKGDISTKATVENVDHAGENRIEGSDHCEEDRIHSCGAVRIGKG